MMGDKPKTEPGHTDTGLRSAEPGAPGVTGDAYANHLRSPRPRALTVQLSGMFHGPLEAMQGP